MGGECYQELVVGKGRDDAGLAPSSPFSTGVPDNLPLPFCWCCLNKKWSAEGRHGERSEQTHCHSVLPFQIEVLGMPSLLSHKDLLLTFLLNDQQHKQHGTGRFSRTSGDTEGMTVGLLAALAVSAFGRPFFLNNTNKMGEEGYQELPVGKGRNE